MKQAAVAASATLPELHSGAFPTGDLLTWLAESAWWFDGWRDASWKVGIPPPEVRSVAAAETWLLRVGWKRSTYGLLSITEVPPAARR